MSDTPAAASKLVLTVETDDRESFEFTHRDADGNLTTSTFHLKSRDELSLEQQIALGQNGALMSRLGEDMASASPDEVAALAASIRQAAKDILHDVPDDVFAQMKDGHLLAILGAFGEAPA